LCRKLKSDAATANIPVILMSAAGLHMAAEAGADALAANLFELDVIDAQVHGLLEAASRWG
jgi:hypothetical protein